LKILVIESLIIIIQYTLTLLIYTLLLKHDLNIHNLFLIRCRLLENNPVPKARCTAHIYVDSWALFERRQFKKQKNIDKVANDVT